jgi:hypothetical protein
MVNKRVPLAAVLLASIACSSLQPVPEPAQFIPAMNPELVYVTFHNRAQVPLARPHVSGDSLVGTLAGVGRPWGVPLSQVQVVEAVQRDKRRTRWLIAGLGVVTVAGVYAFSRLGTGDNKCDYSLGPGENPPGCYGP